jgi:hypothetical protein
LKLNALNPRVEKVNNRSAVTLIEVGTTAAAAAAAAEVILEIKVTSMASRVVA